MKTHLHVVVHVVGLGRYVCEKDGLDNIEGLFLPNKASRDEPDKKVEQAEDGGDDVRTLVMVLNSLDPKGQVSASGLACGLQGGLVHARKSVLEDFNLRVPNELDGVAHLKNGANHDEEGAKEVAQNQAVLRYSREIVEKGFLERTVLVADGKVPGGLDNIS